MKKILVILFAIIALVAVETVDARSHSSHHSHSYRSSSKSTSSWGSSKKSTPKTYTTSSKKTTGFAKSKSTSSTKSIASKTAMDKKMAKKNALISKNNAASKKYGNKKTAEAEYKKKMATSNTYTSKTPPTTRPANIPKSISSGGRNINVSYNIMPGGGYGYGYMDPMTNAFVTLSAVHMIANATAMSNSGYGSYDQYGNPVYQQQLRAPVQPVTQSDGMSRGAIIFLSLFIILIFGVFIVAIIKS